MLNANINYDVVSCHSQANYGCLGARGWGSKWELLYFLLNFFFPEAQKTSKL